MRALPKAPCHLLNARACLLALALAAGLPIAHGAGMRDEEKVPSDRLSSVLQNQFKPAQDANNWTAALAIVDAELGKAEKNSYDEFFLNDLKAKILPLAFQDNAAKRLESIPFFERALELSDMYEIYSPQELEITLINLGQNIYEKANTTASLTPAERVAMMDKAIGYFRRYFDTGRNTDPGRLEYFASILMYRYDAERDKPESVKFIDEAMANAKKALLLWPNRSSEGFKPRESLYNLLAQASIQKQDFEGAIGYLESMLALNPAAEGVHKGLTGIYANLALTADAAKDPRKAEALTLGALGAYHRAQAAGFANTPRDHQTVHTLLANLGKQGLAAEKLERDLKSGAQESTEAMWMTAAQFYRADGRPEKAIQVLRDGSAKFPTSGALEFMAAGVYIGMGDGKNALEMAKKAIQKGMGPNEYKAWGMVAYSAFDQQDYDEALRAINEAMKNPNAIKEDTNLERFKEYIASLIEDREKRKAEALNKI